MTAMPESEPRTTAPRDDATAHLDAPDDLVARYLDLFHRRQETEAALAYARGELKIAATGVLDEETPRGRFACADGSVLIVRRPTCVFDRSVVTTRLQEMGRLAPVARLDGPTLARYLDHEPQVAARLGAHVRRRARLVFVPERRVAAHFQ